MIEVNSFHINVPLLTACITLISMLSAMMLRLVRQFDTLQKIVKEWNGDGAEDGLIVRISRLESKVNDIQYNVKPNHGGSALDAQNRKIDDIIKYLKEKEHE